MIYLRKVSKYHLDALLGHEAVLRDVSFAFPTDRPIAILGADARSISTILLMLTGSRVPDKGEIDRGRIRCSPVINSGGGAAAALLPQLSPADNVRMLADLYSVDRHKLLALVESAGNFGAYMNLPLRKLDWARRRTLEAAAIIALPFDCYFVDRLRLIDPGIVTKLFHVTRLRGAGIIFTTDRVQQAVRLASAGVLVSNGQLHWTENLGETLAAHGPAAGQDAASS